MIDYSKIGHAIRQAFLEQKINPWRGFTGEGVNPPVDWETIGEAAAKAVMTEIAPRDPSRRAKVFRLCFEEAESRRAAMSPAASP